MKPSSAKANEPQSSYSTMPMPPQAMPMPATAPFVADGIPVSSTGQLNISSGGMATFQIQSQPPVKWSTGLCGCCEDVPNCCLTCWCPCVTFGRLAEIVDRGSTSCGASGALYTLLGLVTGCACCYSCFYRSKMRRLFSLRESPCCDCLVHCCCEYCALCQEYRELKSRGFDMVIGWHGNLEKQTPGIMSMMPPSTASGMTR